MSDQDDNVVYRFEPQFDGAFIYGLPQRGLTQAEFDALEPRLQREATAPHPLYGTPLYVEAGASTEPPKWFRAKQEQAGEGVAIEPLLANETKAQYEERIAALEAEATAPDEPPTEQDGDA